MDQKLNVFGINFFQGNYKQCISQIYKGAFMIVPSAPSLVLIEHDKGYHNSLKNSDFAILDSGLLSLLLKITTKVKIKKFSGFEFLQNLLNDARMKEPNVLFMVDPSKVDSTKNHKLLVEKGFKISKKNHYVAPIYSLELRDNKLLDEIEEKRPKVIMINLGGGVQEKLGFFLKSNLTYNPGIICTGAAISFFTGRQASISKAIDKLYLGWFWRCLDEPKTFIPRYLSGFKLIPIYLKYLLAKKNRK